MDRSLRRVRPRHRTYITTFRTYDVDTLPPRHGTLIPYPYLQTWDLDTLSPYFPQISDLDTISPTSAGDLFKFVHLTTYPSPLVLPVTQRDLHLRLVSGLYASWNGVLCFTPKAPINQIGNSTRHQQVRPTSKF